ncbi:alpha/beta fold hydrolase [Janthinobacterium agaricidamnosum]|uniref:Alpha/beta hydrolase fold family protein n=1 Tax=Janthinobacterium agaricidamnosum NBRC 102515 = DSM 9628 TaxID=1349767 RepID=W0V9M6_9BURK|nr:alpha/beta hydrolase [Janthinobacterium agaricidamnosum]CDG84048.1 alpha/beta hydrolase fold family protein [Janthinobacterium agaricidamnosum NBRC 102515 = DSM 9628]
MQHTHISVPTSFIDANGHRYAYRRFGSGKGVPLIFLQHFRGGMDHWDPLITDGLAQGRTVILFDNAGVAASSGATPDTIEAMADHVALFLGALGYAEVDVLGFSLGGYVAQQVAFRHAHLVRRLVLAGTGPRAGVLGTDARVVPAATGNPIPTLEDFLILFFGPSDASQAAGRAFWERRHWRTADLDVPSSQQTMMSQLAAIAAWRQPKGEPYAELKVLRQPTLVVNGSDDIMVPTINSYNLAQHIPNAQLIIYPDSGHGAHFQYPALFLQHVGIFLDA